MPTQKRDETSVVPAAADCPAADEPVKTCGKCSRSLPLSQFYRDAHARDGYFRQCRACHRITVRAWTRKNRLRINARRRQRYRQNRESIQAQNRKWYAANREKVKQWSREYRAAHREEIRAKAAEYTRRNRHKTRAHNAVREAINTGRLVRGMCEVCEAQPQDQQIYAHHEDYSRPLEVRWLCRTYHIL